ncbi:MAG: hypothetical protein AB8F94_02890 [Saprospiraceae bacterium]
MKSKQNYSLMLFFVIPFFGLGQSSVDTIPVSKDVQTPKGVSLNIPFSLEEMATNSKIAVKSHPSLSETKKETLALTVQNPISKNESTPIDELQIILEKDLARLTKELSIVGLEYRKQRILKIKKEETEYDLSFLNRLHGIKETIAYETTGNSENFIISAEQFLDTLYNENSNVSEQFKDLSQERYDNYLAKDKIVKLRINDVKVERNKGMEGDGKKYKYSGFAILDSFGKKVRVEFFSDGFIRRSDEKLMYEVAKEDNIEQTITVEGIIDEFKYGRINSSFENDAPTSLSIILINEWIIIDRDQLIQEFEKAKKF